MRQPAGSLRQVAVPFARRHLQQLAESSVGSGEHEVSPGQNVPSRPSEQLFLRYSRLLSPKYGDGYSSPTVSVTGQDLPNSRLVSLVAFGENDVADPQFTLANMQWGQIVTHDMSMLAGSTQSSE